jgi:putative Ca2+/H+ antiporter (TMEM165/GDT1 family)
LAGERAHRRLSSALLRRIYAVLVTLIALRVWLTILGLDK